MSDGSAYLDILFFAMVAAFIAFRLRNVLGRKTGHERPRTDPISQRAAANRGNDNVVPMPERGPTPPGDAAVPPVADGPAAAGVAAIAGPIPASIPTSSAGRGLRSR